MNPDQTCPHCHAANRVFGLYDEGPVFKDKPQVVRCVKCGKIFEAKEKKEGK